MINKPNDLQPNDGQGIIPTKIIQTNPAGNILGSLTTIAMEGGFGGTDTSHRSMIYLSPSMTFFVNDKLGSHEFRGGADLYPNIENKTSSNLAPALPTNPADREFHQNVAMPNFGLSFDSGRWAVFRGTAQRSYEWLDLGGGDGTSHAPNVLATDVFRASPRTNPTLNQSLPGGFPLGVAFGDLKDGSVLNGRTYVNEFSGSWEHRLPHTSSISTTFLWRRNWDYQSGDDYNVIRDPKTGALLDRPFPDYDSIINTYNPNYTWQQNRSLQLLYTKNFAGNWGVNANYSYIVSTTIRTRWNATRDTLQFYGISPDDVLSQRATGRHLARFSGFVKLPY